MNKTKFTFIFLLLCIFFSNTLNFNLLAKQKNTFLEIVSIMGKTPDLNAFSLKQNLFIHHSNQYDLFSKKQPYFHQGLTVDPFGYIYFCDKSNSQILIYDSLGNPIRSIGSVGNEEGQFQILSDICIDQNGTIYALDTFRNNIQVFNRDGSFISDFSLSHPSDKETAHPIMMALSNDKNLFIIDINNGCKVFSKKGTWLTKIKSNFDNLNLEAFLGSATDICTDEEGKVYIMSNLEADRGPFFMILNPDGKISHRELIALNYGEDERENSFCPSFSYFQGMFYLTILNESIYESSTYSCLEATFQKYTSKIEDIYQIETKVFLKEISYLPISLIKTINSLILMDGSSDRIIFYDQFGKISKEIKSTINYQLLLDPRSASFDIDENLYVCDPKHNRVTALNISKNEVFFLDPSIQTPFYKNFYEKELWEPTIVVKDNVGNFYVYDNVYKEIHILDSQKQPIRILSPNHSEVIALNFDTEGMLYVLGFGDSTGDIVSAYIEVYSTNSRINTIKKVKTIIVKDEYAIDMTIDQNDNIYLSCINKILVYSKDGQKIDEWLLDDILIRSIYRTTNNLTYVLSDSTLLKLNSDGEIINQQNLGWFHLSDMTGNNQSEIYLTDDFHGLIITLTDTTYVKSPRSTPLKLKNIPNETFFNRILIQGRSSPSAKIKIQNLDFNAKTDGTFAEYVNLGMTLNSNKILISARNEECGETVKSIIIDKLAEVIQIYSVTNSEGKDGNCFIDKETKRSYVPFRRISESLGAKVIWDGRTQIITTLFPDITIEIHMGSSKARVNGKVRYMDSEYKEKVFMKVVGGKTFVPLRFFTESYGCRVSWDSKQNKITVIYPDQNFYIPDIIDPPEDFDSLEWSKQYGVSKKDNAKLLITHDNKIISINHTSRKDGNLWFLRCDTTGKSLQSILFNFPYQQSSPLSIIANQNNLISAFAPSKNSSNKDLNISKEPLGINFFTIDTKGMIQNSKYLSIQSGKKMFVSYKETFSLSGNRFLLNYSVLIEGQDSNSFEGFSLIDSSGKHIESYFIEIKEEKYKITTSIHPTGINKFALLIIKKYRNDLTEMELIGFNEVGNVEYKVSLPAMVENYSYPKIIVFKIGFLIMTKMNDSVTTFARFNEKGNFLWSKEMLFSEKDLSITSIQEGFRGEIKLLITQRKPKSTGYVNYLAKLSSEGEIMRTFYAQSRNYAYLLTTGVLEDGSEIIIGNQALRAFAESNLMICKWDPLNPKSRVFHETKSFIEVKAYKNSYKKSETNVSKIKIPITIKNKDIQIPFKENTPDYM